MDQTEDGSQQSPPSLLSVDDIEIPEPDYDDVTTHEETLVAEKQAGIDQSFDFNIVRAKMEAFSRDETALSFPDVNLEADEPAIPEPDYPDSDEDDCCDAGGGGEEGGTGSERTVAATDAEPDDPQTMLTRAVSMQGPPRSKEMLALHRELTFNQRQGLNVIGKKSELTQEMNKRKLRQQQRDEEERKRQTRSTFDQRMEEQAKKIEMAEQAATGQVAAQVDEQQAEFLRVHSRISKMKEVC